jgi:hypothetical protein
VTSENPGPVDRSRFPFLYIHTRRRGKIVEVLTSLRVKNFKRLEDVEIELGKNVLFVGPNNSGKRTALQALALWEIGLRKWVEKRSTKDTPEKRPGVTINRRDLIAVPVPDANLLWRDLHVRAIQKRNGKQDTKNIRIDIVVSGVTDGTAWDCGFEFDYANQESFYCRPLRSNEDPQPVRMPVPLAAAPVRVAFLPPMSGMAATEDRLQDGAVNVRIGEGRTAEVLRNLCFDVSGGEKRSHSRRLKAEPRHHWPEREAKPMERNPAASGGGPDSSSSEDAVSTLSQTLNSTCSPLRSRSQLCSTNCSRSC